MTSGLGRILVVEDEGIVAADLADTLASLGYDVVATVDTADAAVSTAAATTPDIILMDVRLAGATDGIEAARRIRRQRDIPVVFLTAHSDDATLARALDTQPLGYLTKPFRAPELRCAIELALHKQEIDRRLQQREQELSTAIRTNRLLDEILAVSPREADADVRRANAELEQRVVDRTSQLEAANQELQAFSFSIAHDLRAPLRGIDGFSQILIEDHAANLGAEALEHLHRIRRAVDRMSKMIDDLLRLSLVARTELVHEPVDLSALAAEIVRELAPRPAVRIAIEPGLTAHADAGLLRIALTNLLANAIKFTGKVAAPQIEIARSEADPAVYRVRDNGAGFDPQDATRLFGAFQRLHPATEYEGTGIGLAIVQRIIHRHGGRVWAEGAVGRGATFSFKLGS